MKIVQFISRSKEPGFRGNSLNLILFFVGDDDVVGGVTAAREDGVEED